MISIILDSEVNVNLSNKNIKHFESLGYIIPRYVDKKNRISVKRGTKIKVNPNDLPHYSEVKINVDCDACGDKQNIMYYGYINNLRNGKYYCNLCAKNGFKKWQSLGDKHPNLLKYFVNSQDAFKITSDSNKEVLLKCPKCGHEKYMKCCNFSRRGFACVCNDHISYPEKFMYNFLNQINQKFVFQLSKSTFKWCGEYRYDFYLPNLNLIIEVNGEQHYKNAPNFRNIENQKEIDRIKKELALNNNIKKYIIIDARFSSLDFIKQSIYASELRDIFDLKNIDFDECNMFALNNSFIVRASELWNDDIHDTLKISQILKVARCTAIEYLKKGNQLGITDYTPKGLRKKVVCVNTGKTFESLSDAAKYYSANADHISKCCKGLAKSSGTHPKIGEKLLWKFADE